MSNSEYFPVVIDNDQYEGFQYRWQPQANTKCFLVTIFGSGGGGAGGESTFAGTFNSRVVLNAGGGNSGMFCTFKYFPDANDPNIELSVGKGGAGGKAGQYGADGEETRFGDWVRVEGGRGGTYSSSPPEARVIWRESKSIKMIAYGLSQPGGKTVATSSLPSFHMEPGSKGPTSAGSQGGQGGRGANGQIIISRYE